MYCPAHFHEDKLIGHVAKSNPLWQRAASDELLAVFQGPSSYISPNWYATKHDAGKVVPTWNYAVVHARCIITAIHDRNHRTPDP